LINISLIPFRRWNFKAAAPASLVARFLILYNYSVGAAGGLGNCIEMGK